MDKNKNLKSPDIIDGAYKMIGDKIYLIDKNRHDKLNMDPYNAALDGMKDKNNFSDEFTSEILEVKKLFTNYFNRFGKFGSLERYYDKKPSDWWMNDDTYSTARVLFIDLLNPKLQEITIIQGAQKELFKLKNDWMLMIGHKNDYDALGEFIGKTGEYYFWVTKNKIEIYSEKEDDILLFMKSLKIDSSKIENEGLKNK